MRPIQNQLIMVTGATDGLGKAVTLELARRGAWVLLHGRSDERGKRTIEEIRAEVPEARLEFFRADFAHLSEVRQLAKAVRAEHSRLDALVNNAGIYLDDRQESADGNELVFQVNFLAHVILTESLLPILKDAAPSRIVNVASAGQSSIDFDDIRLESTYSGSTSYQRSKLAQIMYTFDLAERLASEHITVNALHPATFMPTKMVVGRFPPSSKIQEGVDATVRLISAPELEGVTGRYFNMQNERRAHPQAYDAEARRRLSELTETVMKY